MTLRRLVPGLLLAALCAAASAFAQAPLPDGFYRYPTIGGGVIVFSSEGDLWKVPAVGGVAQRLTSSDGEERFPRLSPDGRRIAFTAQYDGNDDVYVMGVAGGEPRRLTFHPTSDQALGWTPDGRILFRSRRDHPHGDFRCFTIAPEGGIPQLIRLEPAAWLAFEPGGTRVALQKTGLEFHNWKRYKGGEAEEIYVGTPGAPGFTEIARWDGKDAFPMWYRDGLIYFVTDRWGRPNLARMNADGGELKRLTDFEDYDVRWPSLGDDKIVYQHRMDIWCYDLATGKNAPVTIQLPSDRLQVRRKWVEPADYITGWTLSKDGERIALEARGDLFVARTKKKGFIRPVTASSRNRTRVPAFAPDGKSIAAFTEVEGEEQLVLHSADGSAPPRTLGHLPPGWFYRLAWMPDGKGIAYSDKELRLRWMDVATGAVSTVDSSAIGPIRAFDWSPDGRYLAYSVALDNLYSQVRIWDARTRQVHPVSDSLFDASGAAWDPDGQYLYYLSARHYNPYVDRAEARFIINNAMVPVVVALQADGKLPFPLLNETDPAGDDRAESADKPAGGKPAKPAGAAAGKADARGKSPDAPPAPIRIDFEGLMQRTAEVPVPPANYAGLRAISGKLHFLGLENRGLMPPKVDGDDDEQDAPAATLYTYDLDARKLSTVTDDVLSYDVSADGRVLVYQTKEGFTRLEAGATSAPTGDDLAEAQVKLEGWTLSINPREEWQQELHEVWRLQRDFFYDRQMHGVDWEAVRRQYEPLAERISTRDDLNDIFGELLGELSVGHAYFWGGDLRRPKPVGTGLLGADLTYEPSSGFWRIDRIFRGDYPTVKWASPLARPDLNVRPGQWLVAVNGVPLARGEDWMARLANRAGLETELSINDAPQLKGARRIIVQPIPNETGVRYADWVRTTRARVDSLSGGQIGYLHLYDMDGLGLQQFARDFPPQWKKRGFIIDDRWNHGGWVAPMIVAHLDRKLFSIGKYRYSRAIYTSPDRAFHGYLSCLINRQGGSDCETLAQAFKDFGLGPVIGKRTWGGWIGIDGDKVLRDGGVTTQPEDGGWDPQGKAWQIEGHGVDPDVELDLDPTGFLDGRDEVLEYAVKDLLAKIAQDPRNYAPPPPIPPRPLRPGKP